MDKELVFRTLNVFNEALFVLSREKELLNKIARGLSGEYQFSQDEMHDTQVEAECIDVENEKIAEELRLVARAWRQQPKPSDDQDTTEMDIQKTSDGHYRVIKKSPKPRVIPIALATPDGEVVTVPNIHSEKGNDS